MTPSRQRAKHKSKKIASARPTRPKPTVVESAAQYGPSYALGGADASAPPADPGQPDDRLVLRLEAARIVGVSVPTIRRYEKSALKPIVVDEEGVHWHSLRACEQLSRELRSSRPGSRSECIDGVTSAAAFKLFDAGSDAADVIKALEIVPAYARTLQKEWADLRGVMLISGETLSKIRSFRMTDDNPILTGEELLLFLEHVDVPSCRACSRDPVFCLGCYYRRPRKAEEILALALRRSEEREAARQRERVERETYEQARQRGSYDPAAAAAARAERDVRIAARQATRPKATHARKPRSSDCVDAATNLATPPTASPVAGAGAAEGSAFDAKRDTPAAASAPQSVVPADGPADPRGGRS